MLRLHVTFLLSCDGSGVENINRLKLNLFSKLNIGVEIQSYFSFLVLHNSWRFAQTVTMAESAENQKNLQLG